MILSPRSLSALRAEIARVWDEAQHNYVPPDPLDVEIYRAMIAKGPHISWTMGKRFAPLVKLDMAIFQRLCSDQTL